MENLRTILFLFIFLVLAGCQAKQGDSDGDLFSGHVVATNSFTLGSMSSKTYVLSETINFVVNFPFDMTLNTTGGSPRLKITVGSTVRYAAYQAQADASELHFTYTVTAGESDLNGVDVNALELNGSVITFDHDGVPTNADVSTLASQNVPAVNVDAAAPTITGLTLVNTPGVYLAGSSINFNITFSENVYVTGVPTFKVLLSATNVDANYVSGSGTNILTFRYVVSQTAIDTNGYDDIHTFSLPAGAAIKDGVNQNSSLDFSAYVAAVKTYSNNVDINGRIPLVSSVDFPDDGTYTAAQNLDFLFTFDRNVTVGGATTPYLPVTIGSNTRQAQYLSTNNNVVTFRYTTVPGDVAPLGISVPNAITQNGGTLNSVTNPTSFFGNNKYTVPVTTGIIINAVQPAPISVTRNIDTTAAVWGTAVDNVWIIDQVLYVTVGFNTNMYVTQTNGTPYIPLTIGSTVKNAPYLSGGDGKTALVFSYQIVEGDLDTDNAIGIGSIVLNNGVIVDAYNTNTLLNLPQPTIPTTKIDGVKPLISTVTAPPNDTYSNDANADYQDMIFTVNWSEPVHYSTNGIISMDVGGTATPLQSYNNDVAAITHRPTAALGTRNDSDGVTLGTSVTGAVIKDQAGNPAANSNFTAPNTTGVLVDTVLPLVSSISAISSASSYKAGETIDFSVTFSETVTIVASGGYPRIPMTIGSATAYMVANASGTGTTHTFRYTVAAGENDIDGIASVATVQNNGTTAYVRDAGRNYAVTGVAQAFPTHFVDTTAPAISSVTKTANGTYETGDNIQFTLNYSENVFVDTSGGTPRIAVSIGGNTRYMNYLSGSGTTALIFRYTLVSTDFDVDGLPSSINTLSLNSGTINDIAGNSSPTTFAAQDLSNILAVFLNTDLWVQSSFVSKAKSGSSPVVTNSGAVGTLDNCGNSTCRRFDGDGDTLSATLTGVLTVFIVFRTPPTAFFQDRQIFSSDIRLNAQNNDFDLTTSSNAKIILDGGTQTATSTTSFNINMAESSVHVLQVDFDAGQNMSGNLVETGFDGSIGEIWAINGALTTAQKDTIRNYLLNKF
jgi:hypothetical protein